MITYPIRLLFYQSPFLRILISFALGILLFYVLPTSSILIPLIVFILSACAFLGFNYLNLSFKHTYQYLRGLLLVAWLCAAGYFICLLQHAPSSAHWYSHHIHENSYLELRIKSELEEKNKTFKAEAEVLRVLNGDSNKNVNGEILLYFSKGDSIPNLKYGDHIYIKNKLQPLKGSGNPGAFDYAAYCKSKNWYHSAYLRSTDWQHSDKSSTDITSLFASWNSATRNILKKNIPDTNVIGIAEALLIGYRKDVDQDTWQAYSNTGIVHIIAISGLHMAMVYATARWLLLLLPFMKQRKRLAISIAILFMWLFAALTGLPPSVSRAAVMFTFIGFGEMSDRKIPIYNNLAASAFVLLCINPNWLFDVGFQLSYLALISLVLFYEPIYNSLYVRSKPMDWIWKLMAGTLAAQILTFPLCVYYFHQFPLLFLLTNLVAVPASTVILYLEIVLVLFSWFTPLAKLLGILISFLIQWLNAFVFYLSQFSFAVWSGLQISLVEFMVLFLLVISICAYATLRKSKWLLTSIALVGILGGLFSISLWSTLHQKKIIVFNVPNQSHLQFVSGHQYFSPDEDKLSHIPNWSIYTQQPAKNNLHLNVSDSSFISYTLQDTSVFYGQFEGKTILRTNTLNFTLTDTLNLDYLILSKGIKSYDLHLDEKLRPKTIILDSSIPFYYTEKVKDALKTHFNAEIYTVSDQGALIVDL